VLKATFMTLKNYNSEVAEMAGKFDLVSPHARKNFIRFVLLPSLSLGIVACAPVADNATVEESIVLQPELGTHSNLPYLQRDGLQFKDLNKDGDLNPYEDWRLSAAERAHDLVARMTLEEKAGTLLHGSMSTFGAVDYDMARANRLILENSIGSVITRLSSSAELLASGSNKLQAMAEQRRLGIPLSISTDPRNHFNYLAGASVSAGSFSKWPEALGLAAIGDPELVRQFGDVARQEYRSVGIVQALSPMADLSTEPRWPRVVGTFGEDAELAKVLVGAYIEGFQNGDQGLNTESVAAVVKHWVGYGAAKEGYDSHNYYGRFATFPNDNFEYHIKPFEDAFAANVSGVMPTYSILQDLVYQGEKIEQVGAGYSRYLLTDLLRGDYGFDGVILSDWAITLDCSDICKYGEVDGQRQEIPDLSTAWGVIELSPQHRYAKALDAGIDQFGGVEDPQPLINAVQSGLVTEARLDKSAYRIMLQKFELGLFENPFVDEAHALEIVGNDQFQTQGELAQARALVLLENKEQLLPLSSSAKKLYLYGVDADVATSFGFTVVENVEDADLAILRLNTPFEQPHKNYVFGRRHHEGNLSFEPGNPEYEAVMQASAHVPTIATVFLERPAVMTSIHNKLDALIGNFGVSDKVLLSAILGQTKPEGKLPIELPSSMAAVVAQKEDTPFDSEAPLYPYGYGLSYEQK
jgi:beta-glucosidase